MDGEESPAATALSTTTATTTTTSAAAQKETGTGTGTGTGAWFDVSREAPRFAGEQSAFEFQHRLVDAASGSAVSRVINAGRGNPNFLLTTVRDAFAQLLLFATFVAESGEGLPRGLKVRPDKRGIAKKLQDWLHKNSSSNGSAFLSSAISFIHEKLDLEADDIVFELFDAAQGDYYPVPPQMLPMTELIVRQYLNSVLFHNHPPLGTFSLFATEGATAAMIYLFNTLKVNHILAPGDKVAIITPIFSPYLEIPGLSENGFTPVYLSCQESLGWQLGPEEIAKLRDTSIKALFEVNPGNPSSYSMSRQTVTQIAQVIREHNPNLIVISDCVYANFVDEFHSLLHEIPQNVIGVYSFSKYFGVTGWRLGVVMVHQNTVLDTMIAQLPDEQRKQLAARYRIITPKPDKLRFMARLQSDSRCLALGHTAGLSGPQQAIMGLFALHELLDEKCSYRNAILGILRERWNNLHKGLGVTPPDTPSLTRYYALLNIAHLAEDKHGKEFATWLVQHTSLFGFLKLLAERHFTVCLPGTKFAGPDWSIRVSVANVCAEECTQIGSNIVQLLAYMAHRHATDSHLLGDLDE
ncbi:bifunctional aspartate transaminase/aspartate 4-decarboxylase [Pelomyxa schiedti]|nr:bifunctional aspartate transaminase/aspartate 4-decarboxylase [Pelomyxa schiedti]